MYKVIGEISGGRSGLSRERLRRLAAKICQVIQDEYPDTHADVEILWVKGRGSWSTDTEIPSVPPNCDKNSPEYVALMKSSIEALPMTASTTRHLKAADIFLIGELLKRTKLDLERIQGIGRKQLNEIERVLAAKGLKLAG